jgi:hypothetical protein
LGRIAILKEALYLSNAGKPNYLRDFSLSDDMLD